MNTSSRDPFPFPQPENDNTFTGTKPLQVPHDSLDFHLKSLYDHHEDFLRTRNQTLTLKEREKQEMQQKNLKNDSIRVWITPQKCSIYSIKGTIESHHNANRGYSRKHDGGFYST
uniref:Uncharacterized protein n=1 Tax=Gadus morhua TaxID=8049 RepID=A0A8C5FAC9_GADMO